MSIIFEDSNGWVLSHDEYLRSLYKNVSTDEGIKEFNFSDYFKLTKPFTRGKVKHPKHISKKKKTKKLSKEALAVNKLFDSIKKSAQSEGILTCWTDFADDNYRSLAHKYFESIQFLASLNGGNMNSYSLQSKINNDLYIFPPKCKFYNDDISMISKHLGNNLYDFILLDPPWYNRFVKRRKKFHPEHGYSFMDCKELIEIPVKNLLKPSGLVAVWTTNSETHVDSVTKVLFPAWGVIGTSTWYWIKVAKNGELVVPFTTQDAKQPYERLIFGRGIERTHSNPEDMKCIISVPSCIHSHKPPIIELIKKYLPDESNCLELFARYLLPNWTSYGNQVLSLQLQSLFC